MPLYRHPKSPYWWVRIGRKTRRSAGTTDRGKAEEFERVLRERFWRAEKLGDRSAISWLEVAERWLGDSPRPRKRDRELLAWLEPRIGDEMLSSVADPDALEEIRRDALADGWSRSTIDRLMNTVRAVLRAAVRWRYLEHAPAIPMYRPATQEPRWLTRAQFESLRQELPEHLALAAQFAVLTMLRMRAMGQLTWDRVDLKARRAWVPGRQMKGARTFGFPLSSEAVKVLRKLKTLSPTGGRVFQYEGKPIDNFNTAAFRKAAERSGVAPLRWHDLRHTGASWAVQSGVALPELMALGDWRSYSMVLRYAHLAPSHAAEAAERLAKGSTPPRTDAHRRAPKSSRVTRT